MAELRDGFRDIVQGWTLVDDFDDLTDRIERAAEWAEENRPLSRDERATVDLMIRCQVARGLVLFGPPAELIMTRPGPSDES